MADDDTGRYIGALSGTEHHSKEPEVVRAIRSSLRIHERAESRLSDAFLKTAKQVFDQFPSSNGATVAAIWTLIVDVARDMGGPRYLRNKPPPIRFEQIDITADDDDDHDDSSTHSSPVIMRRSYISGGSPIIQPLPRHLPWKHTVQSSPNSQRELTPLPLNQEAANMSYDDKPAQDSSPPYEASQDPDWYWKSTDSPRTMRLRWGYASSPEPSPAPNPS